MYQCDNTAAVAVIRGFFGRRCDDHPALAEIVRGADDATVLAALPNTAVDAQTESERDAPATIAEYCLTAARGGQLPNPVCRSLAWHGYLTLDQIDDIEREITASGVPRPCIDWPSREICAKMYAARHGGPPVNPSDIMPGKVWLLAEFDSNDGRRKLYRFNDLVEQWRTANLEWNIATGAV